MPDDPECPRFTPVPSRRNRRDGWTPARQRDFLIALARIGSVRAAARAVGLTPRSAQKLRLRPGAESFARAWDEALDCGVDHARFAVMDRALNGELVPRYYAGRIVGYDRHFDDRITLGVLNSIRGELDRNHPGNRPEVSEDLAEKYREEGREQERRWAENDRQIAARKAAEAAEKLEKERRWAAARRRGPRISLL